MTCCDTAAMALKLVVATRAEFPPALGEHTEEIKRQYGAKAAKDLP